MEMAIPAVLGWWLDRKLDTSPWCLSAGGGIGLALGLLHLVQFSARKGDGQPGQPEATRPNDRHVNGP